MEEFLTYIQLLLGVLGHKLLEKAVKPTNPATTTETIIENDEQPLKLYLNVAGVKAQAIQTDEGIVVLKGSESANKPQPSLSDRYKKIWQSYIDDGTLKHNGTRYEFQRDVIFNTPSPAASIVAGSHVSGPQSWKDANGKSLKKIEEEQIKDNF